MKIGKLLFLSLSLLFFINVQAQDTVRVAGYKFTKEVRLPYTDVKSQNRTGTCWSYATTSFVESELLRMGKPSVDLSEMFFVKDAYLQKGVSYVRRNGTANFSEGGQAHDVMNTIKAKGMVPDAIFPGLNYGEKEHVHGELTAGMTGFLEAINKNPNRQLSTAWLPGLKGILDAYLGQDVTSFSYNGKNYTPASFRDANGFNPDDYIELTSFSNYPYNTKVMLEIADNWSNGQYYNLPINDIIKIIENAVAKGYTVCWDGDVGNTGFSHGKGLAVVPDENTKEVAGLEMAKWSNMSSVDKKKALFNGDSPIAEKLITDADRAAAFDNTTLTDDHLMHLVGLAKDQTGATFYIIKNSWAKDSNAWGGLFYMSQPYVKRFTVAIMVHKNAIPADIKKVLGL
ncbi:C1 family peptidase [Williamwhitmania taraxaci]|uniref:Aminopeptidase n=1 Tax=Williamwhitmania taraxaci TaxID=1640674 RepID=A0A1G6MY06_9BACT|nr:C1 family peptidase [Williamwhitmania taraxaci]SDC59866.1 bleomycin hydrolase [Williamwhitmania taraxaci]